MKYSLICSCLFVLTNSAEGGFSIAREGKAPCVVLRQAGATEPEQFAIEELTNTLHQITGAEFKVSEKKPTLFGRAIIVGPGPLAEKYFPEIDLDKLGGEELVMRSRGNMLLLAGGRPRGTIYAVNRFLQEQCGVRWWTPWATNLPHLPTLKVADLNLREKPAFEYRAPFWFCALDPLWRVRNNANNQQDLIPAALGGCVQYKGYAHTFYPLVPPEKYFAKHPEWFSMINGQRTTNRAQLCLTNPKLRDFVVGRVEKWLRESPEAQIISVTQNDWYGWCECPECKAVDEAEGSPSGTMLAFVNYIAEKIQPHFPNVAVDTFAYQYTRKPPRTIKPRENVIVRLCSIECNFREPLDHPSNAAFLSDLEGWSKICSHLYVWDYTTDFWNYVHPHPNWFTLGANARLFQKYGMKGLFEQGAYSGPGAEMAELRAWLLSQLLWNPRQDDRALIQEFVEGYYGKHSAQPILCYLDLLYAASEGVYLSCFLRKEPLPHLNFDTLAAAEKLWQKAEQLADGDIEKLTRIRIAHLPVRYSFLKTWNRLRRECWEQNGTWPLSESRKVVAEDFRATCQGVPGKDWTKVNYLNESRLTVDEFLKGFAEDPLDKYGTPPPRRLTNPSPPSDLSNINPARCVDLQDNGANLYWPGKFVELYPDSAASDLRAARILGDRPAQGFRIEGTKLPSKALNGTWRVYAVVRVTKLEKYEESSIVFTAGIYDNQKKNDKTVLKVTAGQVDKTYHSHLLGTVELNAHCDIWISTANHPGIKAIWVDRIYLTPASEPQP